MLTSREAKRALRSAKAEAAVHVLPYRPKDNKHRCQEVCRVGRNPRLPSSWVRIGRKLTSSEASWTVGSSEAEASEEQKPKRAKVAHRVVTLDTEGRKVGRS